MCINKRKEKDGEEDTWKNERDTIERLREGE